MSHPMWHTSEFTKYLACPVNTVPLWVAKEREFSNSEYEVTQAAGGFLMPVLKLVIAILTGVRWQGDVPIH